MTLYYGGHVGIPEKTRFGDNVGIPNETSR